MENTNLEALFFNNDLSLSETDTEEILGGLRPQNPNAGDSAGQTWNRPCSPVCSSCGVGTNHNETVVEDGAEEISDLTVSNGSEIKGGPLKRIRVGGMSFGDENGTSN